MPASVRETSTPNTTSAENSSACGDGGSGVDESMFDAISDHLNVLISAENKGVAFRVDVTCLFDRDQAMHLSPQDACRFLHKSYKPSSMHLALVCDGTLLHKLEPLATAGSAGAPFRWPTCLRVKEKDFKNSVWKPDQLKVLVHVHSADYETDKAVVTLPARDRSTNGTGVAGSTEQFAALVKCYLEKQERDLAVFLADTPFRYACWWSFVTPVGVYAHAMQVHGRAPSRMRDVHKNMRERFVYVMHTLFGTDIDEWEEADGGDPPTAETNSENPMLCKLMRAAHATLCGTSAPHVCSQMDVHARYVSFANNVNVRSHGDDRLLHAHLWEAVVQKFNTL